MDAHPDIGPPLSAPAGAAVPGGGSVAWRLAALAFAGLVAACGTQISTPMPDPGIRTNAADGIKPKSAAEQQKAIDDLIAKRDAPR